jgi:hypothetical protein
MFFEYRFRFYVEAVRSRVARRVSLRLLKINLTIRILTVTIGAHADS